MSIPTPRYFFKTRTFTFVASHEAVALSEPPTKSISSAICVAVLVFVPLVKSSAVTLASPGRFPS